MKADPSPSLDENIAHVVTDIVMRGWDNVPIQPARGAGAWGTGENCPGRERAGAAGMDHEGSETVLVALGSSASWDDITALVFAEMFGSVSPVAHEKALYKGTA